MSLLSRIYRGLRRRLPRKLESLLVRAASRLPGQPSARRGTVRPGRFPGAGRGGLTLSADFEMGWAFRFSKANPNPGLMAARTRENVPFLLDRCAAFRIPVTWATVGHLLLDGCRRGDHDWMRTLPHFENRNWRFDRGGWFDADPHCPWQAAREWYAPDLVGQILESPAGHEVACHTFSHIDCSDLHCPPAVLADELRAWTQAAQPWGIPLRSFVFPGGTFGNFATLREAGVRTYRRRAGHDLAYPQRDPAGLLVSPVSRELRDNGFGWSDDSLVAFFTRYLDRAVQTGTLCHFWFHPSADGAFFRRVLPGVLRHAAELRENGKLWIGTMGEMAQFLDRAPAAATTGRTSGA